MVNPRYNLTLTAPGVAHTSWSNKPPARLPQLCLQHGQHRSKHRAHVLVPHVPELEGETILTALGRVGSGYGVEGGATAGAATHSWLWNVTMLSVPRKR